ncbi:MAG: cyclase family protein [Actinobacteria bacterium]|nr:cyclase family protein [Actinomycetota bacterium]
MSAAEGERTVFEPLLERDGLVVSASPWGPGDEIGRLNWITPESTGAVLSQLRGERVYDLSVDYFVGMPAFTVSGDPPYQSFVTHTPQASVLDGMTGTPGPVHERYSLSADAILMNTHCGTHIDTLTHMGHCGTYWNGWTADEQLGGRGWMVGGASAYPPVIARGVLLDIAALHDVACLPDGYAITAADARGAAERQGVRLQRADVVLLRTGVMERWPQQSYLESGAGVGLEAASLLCEEHGAMVLGTDTIAFEVIPHEEPETFLPVHGYMFATAGAQIIEVLWLEELAAQECWEFAFLGMPLRLRGSTGSPMRPVAIPIGG